MPDATDRHIGEVRHFEHPSGVDKVDIRYADGAFQMHVGMPELRCGGDEPDAITAPETTWLAPVPRSAGRPPYRQLGIVTIVVVMLTLAVAACTPPPVPPLGGSPYAQVNAMRIVQYNGQDRCIGSLGMELV